MRPFWKCALATGLSLTFAMTTASGALALGFTGCQHNDATFETLEEARLSAPTAVQNLEQNETKAFASMDVLDGIAEGTVFVYRSADMYGGRASGRLNTNLLVFAEQHFENKDAAMDYLKKQGLIDIIDVAKGSVILVTPADGEKFGQADQSVYYKIQSAVCSLKGAKNGVAFAEPEYFGGFGYIYAIGLEGGATFLNDYVSSQFDFASRIAGMLLVGGQMESIRSVSTYVPVYMVNPKEDVLEKYKEANGIDASDKSKERTVLFNQEFPLRKIILAKDGQDEAFYIKDAYENLFTQAMRLPVGKAGLYSAGTPMQGLSNDKAPYSLCARNDITSGVTKDGIHMLCKVEDRFSAYKTDEGEYIQTWFEYLPEDVLNNTAEPGSVPLVLAIHGTSDDPRMFVDEIGLLDVASREKMAIVAPEHNALGGLNWAIETEALPALVQYMLETYPALDASRVYAMGYSMGGGSTMKAILASPKTFAAAVPMSPVTYFGDVWIPSEENLAQFENVDLPVMLTSSTYDLPLTYDQENGHILDALQGLVNQMCQINELPEVTFDFAKHPISGIDADRETASELNGEYMNHTWYMNKNGVPMVALNITEGLTHSLYPEYGKLFWEFVKHYSRNVETGEVVYQEYIK